MGLLQLPRNKSNHGADINEINQSGATPLQDLAGYENLDGAKILIDRGARIDLASAVLLKRPDLVASILTRDRSGIDTPSPIGLPLCLVKDVRIAELLFAHGADPNLKDQSGRTPLLSAILQGDIPVIRCLLEHHADTNIPERNGGVPLESLAWQHFEPQSQVSVAALLLAHGARLDIKDSSGRTPLHVAAIWGSPLLTKLLLDFGSDPNQPDLSGATPAGSVSSQEKLQLMLNAGGNLTYRAANGVMPIHTAATNGSGFLIYDVINQGGDVNALTKDGTSPLFFAAASGHLDAVKALLDAGAHIKFQNGAGRTPLCEAIRTNHIEIVKALLNAGSPVNTIERFPIPPGRSSRLLFNEQSDIPMPALTPLDEAACQMRTDIVKLLIARGSHANLFSAILLGDLPLAEQMIHQHPDCVHALAPVDHGASTPLLLAAVTGRIEMVRLLLQHGAKDDVIYWNSYGSGAAQMLRTNDKEILALFRNH